MQDHLIKKENGIAILLVVMIISIVLLTITIAGARLNLLSGVSSQLAKSSRDTYYLSESAIEDGMLRLTEDTDFTGDTTNSPIGTYSVSISNSGNDYTLSSTVTRDLITRDISADVSIVYDPPPITQQALFSSDSLRLYKSGSKVRGNVWTNDDFNIDVQSTVEGNLYSGGKGDLFVNWVWDGFLFYNPSGQGGRVIDNPSTVGVNEGNILAYDTVKVSGPQAYVQGNVQSGGNVYELFGGNVNGTITQHYSYPWTSLPVPNFQFNTYKQQAITAGTFFNTPTSFTNYLSTLNNGTSRTLPSNKVYYVQGTGDVVISTGNPVFLTGTLITEGDLYIYPGFTGQEVNNLPVLVSKKNIYIVNQYQGFIFGYKTSGNVVINGIIFAQQDVDLLRYYSNESLVVNGAVWSGDDAYIEDHSQVYYTTSPQSVLGFDYGVGNTGGITNITLNQWMEDL